MLEWEQCLLINTLWTALLLRLSEMSTTMLSLVVGCELPMHSLFEILAVEVAEEGAISAIQGSSVIKAVLFSRYQFIPSSTENRGSRRKSGQIH